jgi:hypothetical protein
MVPTKSPAMLPFPCSSVQCLAGIWRGLGLGQMILLLLIRPLDLSSLRPHLEGIHCEFLVNT